MTRPPGRSAPGTRIVDAFTGNIAEPPTEFFQALSEADHFIAELDGMHELRARVAELEMALKLAEDDCGTALNRSAEWQQHSERLQARIDELTAERNNLASDLVDLREAHQVTVEKLARYQRLCGRAGW